MNYPKIEITKAQEELLEKFWFIFGNNGKYHTRQAHRFIQCLLEEGKDYREFFKPDKEVLMVVDLILKVKE